MNDLHSIIKVNIYLVGLFCSDLISTITPWGGIHLLISTHYLESITPEYSSLLFQNYVVLGHTADQTHFTNDKHQQGSWAMDIIDTDRLQMAFEAGYKRILLTKLHPIECTPKNNLLIGQFSWKTRKSISEKKLIVKRT